MNDRRMLIWKYKKQRGKTCIPHYFFFLKQSFNSKNFVDLIAEI